MTADTLNPDIRYLRPENLGEAVEFLQTHGSNAKILAGGTDLMVELCAAHKESDVHPPQWLLDVSRLNELKKIEQNEAGLMIGAGVTISEIYASDIIARCAPVLQKTAEHFASRQIRNVATIGGNVAECSPCGDTFPSLLIHEALAVIRNPEGSHCMTIEDLAGGPYRCMLQPNEIITHFILKPQAKEINFFDFIKIGRRRELAVARLSMAVMARQKCDHSIGFIRLAMGACTPKSMRFRDIEVFLSGKTPDENLLWEAGRMLAESMIAVTGRRPSQIYKEPAIQGLFLRMMYPLIPEPGTRPQGVAAET